MTQTQQTIVATFEITGWDETPWDERPQGPALARATVRKRFTGPIEGTSVAQVVTAQGERGGAYVAIERIEGTLDGRAGTFVLQHGGIGDEDDQRSFGSVVPGSGTGDLTGLSGEVSYAHDESGARLTLSYTL